MKRLTFIILLLIASFGLRAEDGYRLWLRYDKIDDSQLLKQYHQQISGLKFKADGATLNAAYEELKNGLNGLLDKKILRQNGIENGSIIAGTAESALEIKATFSQNELNDLGDEGFIIRTAIINKKKVIVIAAKKDIGVLYGTFHFLRLLQTHQPIQTLSITSVPKIKYRVLNHWDNLNRSVERGYSGLSIWDWHTLPGYIDKRYIDYARANASVGINGAVLTNVNANSLILTKQYLIKVKALADAFRPYGIKVFLTARFNSPIEIGK